jgi:hypothetical protein
MPAEVWDGDTIFECSFNDGFSRLGLDFPAVYRNGWHGALLNNW